MINGIARIVVLGILVAAALPACTGDALSKEQLIARGDRICAQLARQRSAIPPPERPAEIPEAMAEVQRVTEDAIARLRELEPPSGDAAQIDEMLDSMFVASQLLPELAQAAASGDGPRLAEATQQIRNELQRAETTARAYGFEDCARTDVDPGA